MSHELRTNQIALMSQPYLPSSSSAGCASLHQRAFLCSILNTKRRALGSRLQQHRWEACSTTNTTNPSSLVRLAAVGCEIFSTAYAAAGHFDKGCICMTARDTHVHTPHANSLSACLFACLPACLSACLPNSLLACQSNRLIDSSFVHSPFACPLAAHY